MSSNIISKAGMHTALNIIVLLLTMVFPTITISLLAITTIISAVFTVKNGLKTAFLSYIATTLLAFLFIYDKGIFLLYAIFFGNYAFVKALIEKKCNLKLEWMLKLICAIGYLVLLYVFSKVLLVALPVNLYVLFALFLIAFVVFDVVLSVILSQIISKFKF